MLCCADIAGRARLEGGASPESTISALAADVQRQPVLVVVQDARLDSGPPRGADSVKLPIQKATVRWLLAWRPTTLAAHRSRLLTVVATLGCMRVNLNEVARLQVCDLWVDYLMSCGVSGFEGTCSVHINRRKNDTQRKGHYPAFGRSWARDSDPGPELDVVTVAQLRHWMQVAGLAVHEGGCAKRARPAAVCELCSPLFPLSRCAKRGVTVASPEYDLQA